MEEYQIKAINYLIRDLERKVLITSHVTKALPQNQRLKVDKEKDVSDKLRKLIEILKKSKDGFSQLLRALSKEKQCNGHLIKKLKAKAHEIQREENANQQELPKAKEVAKFASSDVQKVYQDVSQALNGKCERQTEEFTLEKFTDAVVEINRCKLKLSPNEGNVKNVSLRCLISQREDKHQLDIESMKKQQEDKIEDLHEQLKQMTTENQELKTQIRDAHKESDQKFKLRVDEEVRRRLLKPPTGGKYDPPVINSGEEVGTMLCDDVDLSCVDDKDDEDEKFDALTDFKEHSLSQLDRMHHHFYIGNININANNVNLGTNPRFKANAK